MVLTFLEYFDQRLEVVNTLKRVSEKFPASSYFIVQSQFMNMLKYDIDFAIYSGGQK